MKEKDMDKIAEWMYTAVVNRADEARLTTLAAEVEEYCRKFPLPSDSV
jgi:glycine/serine hydroxymethyltransferase